MINHSLYNPYVALAFFNLAFFSVSGIGMCYFSFSTFEGSALLGLTVASGVLFCLSLLKLHQKKKNHIHQKISKTKIKKSAQAHSFKPNLSLRPNLPGSSFVQVNKTANVRVQANALHQDQVFVSHRTSASSSVRATDQERDRSSSSSISLSEEDVSSRDSRASIQWETSMGRVSSLSIEPPATLSAESSARDILAFENAVKKLSCSAAEFLFALLKKYDKSTSTGKKKEIQKACDQFLTIMLLSNKDAISRMKTHVIFKMPIYGINDWAHLMTMEEKFFPNSEKKEHFVKKINESYCFNQKLNAIGRILLYFKKLLRIGTLLKQCGHKNAAFIEDFNKFKELESKKKEFVKKLLDMDFEECIQEIFAVAKDWPDIVSLEKKWGLEKSLIKKIVEKNPQARKIPIHIKRLKKKEESLLYYVQTEPGFVLTNFVLLDQDLLQFVPKEQVVLSKRDAFDLFTHSIMPPLQLLISSGKFQKVAAKYAETILALQSLSLAPWDKVKHFLFNPCASSMIDEGLLHGLQRADDNPRKTWLGIKIALKLPSTKAKIAQLPTIFQIMLKPFLYTLAPGKFREKIKPILSDFSPLHNALKVENDKETLDMPAILGCFSLLFDNWRCRIEKL